MLTEFGKFLRQLRIDCEELLKDMAVKLEVTPSYLSAVETGKRNIPEGWLEKIKSLYNLDFFAQQEMEKAAADSVNAVKFDLSKASKQKRETTLAFARRFDEVDDDTLMDIRKLLNKQ
jgi:transcriptional regulator with XRE-family HTH domain